DPAIGSFKKIFLTNNAAAIQDHPDDPFSSETTEEEIAFENGKGRAVIKHCACGCARGRIFKQRRFEAGLRFLVMNCRPAVILCFLDNVYLVTAARTVKAARTVFGLKH